MDKQFKLICMAMDGVYIKDTVGTLEHCQNQSADMGSKWYFYPFHFIVTTSIGEIVVDTGSGLIDRQSNESYQSKMFKGRKLATVQKVFKKMWLTIEKQNLQLDCIEYEHYMIAHNHKLIR